MSPNPSLLASEEEESGVTGITIFKHGAYSVVREDGGYYIHNDEQNINEEATSKLFEAIRLCKLYDKFLQEAYALIVPDLPGEEGTEERVAPKPTKKNYN